LSEKEIYFKTSESRISRALLYEFIQTEIFYILRKYLLIPLTIFGILLILAFWSSYTSSDWDIFLSWRPISLVVFSWLIGLVYIYPFITVRSKVAARLYNTSFYYIVDDEYFEEIGSDGSITKRRIDSMIKAKVRKKYIVLMESRSWGHFFLNENFKSDVDLENYKNLLRRKNLLK